LQKKEQKIDELMKLATQATETAEKHKEYSKEKDTQISNISKQLDSTRKQLVAAQNKVKMLSGKIMQEMSKQLEAKIKETEMLKEMLRSGKIELTGKEKEIKRLKAKLASYINSGAVRQKAVDKTNISAIEETPQKPVKSVSLVREQKLGIFIKITSKI